MDQYIGDTIRNNLRWIVRDCTRPQQKAIHEVVRGLFSKGTPILRHLAQDSRKTAKKQGEKYAHHLKHLELQQGIDAFVLRKTKEKVERDTIIAYDLSDIAKESAEMMAGLSGTFDGSKRRKSQGYVLHGVGINNFLVKLELHDGAVHTLNQVRKRIVQEISGRLERKGIWVFDRGNDDKQFFADLRYELKVDFIARIKENRQVVLKETGELLQVRDIPAGKHVVYLLDAHNRTVDRRGVYTLVIRNHLAEKEPIRLLSNLPLQQYKAEKFVTLYLERWGIENCFKRTKQKFDLERIRVLQYQKLKNLIALIQFATAVATLLFSQLQTATTALIASVLLHYKWFIKQKSLTININSFLSFLRYILPPLISRNSSPPDQPHLFSWRTMGKLGPF